MQSHTSKERDKGMEGAGLQWEKYMEEALKEAEKARERDEVPVGCVIVDANGDIKGRGFNRPIAEKDPTAHAEIIAIREACIRAKNYRLSRCFLVSTVEPCLMCVGAIVHSRIEGVVFGCRDEKAGALLSRLSPEELRWLNHKFWIREGILKERCRKLLQNFFKEKRRQKKKVRRGTEARS